MQLVWRLYGFTLPVRRGIMRRQAFRTAHGFRLVLITDDADFAERKLNDVLDFLAAEDPRTLRAIQRQFEYLVVRSVKSRLGMVSDPTMHTCTINPPLLRMHRDMLAAQLAGRALEHRLQCKGFDKPPYLERAAQLFMATMEAAAKRYPHSALQLAAREAAKRQEKAAAHTTAPDA